MSKIDYPSRDKGEECVCGHSRYYHESSWIREGMGKCIKCMCPKHRLLTKGDNG